LWTENPHGSFFPSILERRRRVGCALFAGVVEAERARRLRRKVDDLAAALGVRPRGISKSEVSRVCAGLDEDAGRLSGSTLSTT